jgi:hydroxypyruvate reductase
LLHAFVIATAGESPKLALADGIDRWAAGVIVRPRTLTPACAAASITGLCLGGHDSFTLFDQTGDLIRAGPTGTIVTDIRAILITRGGLPAD